MKNAASSQQPSCPYKLVLSLYDIGANQPLMVFDLPKEHNEFASRAQAEEFGIYFALDFVFFWLLAKTKKKSAVKMNLYKEARFDSQTDLEGGKGKYTLAKIRRGKREYQVRLYTCLVGHNIQYLERLKKSDPSLNVKVAAENIKEVEAIMDKSFAHNLFAKL